jgi:5'-nucleotidase
VTKITKIFVDMDGVLADFIQGVEGPEFLNAPLADQKDYDARKVELSNKGLFKKLPVMSGMLKLKLFLQKCGVEWEVLTCSGTKNRQVVINDKIYWIRKYVDSKVVVTATFKGKDKAFFAKPDRVLIDDRADNIAAWEAAGGVGILFKDAKSTIRDLQLLLAT